VRAYLERQAEQWALHAYLRTCAIPKCSIPGDVEEALLMCLFHLWALENLE
jgi:hypothetical protein